MVKVSMLKREDDGALLVIWRTPKETLVGEVFNNGIEKRGKWDMRATFTVADCEATEYRVREYFGFLGAKEYWKRFA